MRSRANEGARGSKARVWMRFMCVALGEGLLVGYNGCDWPVRE